MIEAAYFTTLDENHKMHGYFFHLQHHELQQKRRKNEESLEVPKHWKDISQLLISIFFQKSILKTIIEFTHASSIHGLTVRKLQGMKECIKEWEFKKSQKIYVYHLLIAPNNKEHLLCVTFVEPRTVIIG